MKVILFELNEVPYKVIHHFCKLYPESNLAKVLSKGRKYETYAEDQGHLSPWVTWPTVHRGVTNEKHLFLISDKTLVNRKNNTRQSGICLQKWCKGWLVWLIAHLPNA
jgi:hypothetical protein